MAIARCVRHRGSALEGVTTRSPRRLLGELHDILDRLGVPEFMYMISSMGSGSRPATLALRFEHGLGRSDAGLGARRSPPGPVPPGRPRMAMTRTRRRREMCHDEVDDLLPSTP